MKISVYNEQSKFPVPKLIIRSQVRSLLQKEGVFCDEIAFHYVSKERISLLHKEYFNDSSVTDCITFPICQNEDKYCFLGEVFICPEVASEYAEKHKSEYFQELTLYLVHGILHLLGFKDSTAQERKKMRRKEKECLDFLTQRSLCVISWTALAK